MRKLHHDEGGWVIVPAMAMLALMLAFGLATLAIVDNQTRATARDERADSSFNGAESVLRGAIAALGTQGAWYGLDTTDSTACRNRTFTAANTAGTVFGTNLKEFVTRTLGTTAGTWKVNLCGVASTAESWSESLLDSRPARPILSPAAPTAADMLWVRAQTTTRGEVRAVVSRADVKSTPIPLPDKYAIATGSMGTSDFGTSVNTLVTHGLLAKILRTTGPLIQDSSGNHALAKIGVRCGLLNLVDPNPDTRELCLAGTLASADDFLTLLGPAGQALTDTLGTGRFVQLPSHQAITQAELESYKRQAQLAGTYYATVADGQPCLPANSTNTSVIYIETIGDGNGTCTIVGPQTKKAAILVVGSGRILVTGDAQDNGTFNGVMYAANKNDSTGDIVTLTNRGWVEGAIFVDGPGKTVIDPPDVTVGSALCDLLPLLQRATCQLLSGLDLLNYVVSLLGVDAVVNALFPQISNYIAVRRDVGLIARPKAWVPSSAEPGPGTFRQLPPN